MSERSERMIERMQGRTGRYIHALVIFMLVPSWAAWRASLNSRRKKKGTRQ